MTDRRVTKLSQMFKAAGINLKPVLLRTVRLSEELKTLLKNKTEIDIVDIGFDFYSDNRSQMFLVFRLEGSENTAEAWVEGAPTFKELMPLIRRVQMACDIGRGLGKKIVEEGLLDVMNQFDKDVRDGKQKDIGG